MSSRNRLRFVTVGLLSTALMSVGSALAWADDGSTVLDFVRHGQSIDNAAGIIDSQPPGSELDPMGITQANDVEQAIQAEYGNSIAGIYASQEIRTQDTAEPLAKALDMWPLQTDHILSGLNEIPAGIFNGYPTDSLEGILYLLGPLAWVFGLDLVPDLGDPSVNGVTFDEGFSNAVQTIYDGTVGSGVSNPTDVAFSSEGAIAVWTLMNVNNPDFSVLLQEIANTGGFLSNTGQVVVEGEPGDWTLVSYDGTAVPQNPGLPTELFVDFRNLIEAPQFAGYDVYEALLTGNSATIDAALQAGLTQVDTALTQFPVEVFDDIVAALGGSI
jgi:histidine phosphatase superfamily protein (branch 1)